MPNRSQWKEGKDIHGVFFFVLYSGFFRQAAGPTPVLTAAAQKVLPGHDWPGNVRELNNILEQAYAAAEGGTIDGSHLYKKMRRRQMPIHREMDGLE